MKNVEAITQMFFTERVVLHNFTYDRVLYMVRKLQAAGLQLYSEDTPSAVFLGCF